MGIRFSGGSLRRAQRLFLSGLFLSAAWFSWSGAVHAAPIAVRVGTTNVSSDIGFFIADKKGYFRDEGLTVAFTTFNSAAKMVAPLGVGQLDVGGGTVAAGLYNAVGRGINVKVVADKGSIQPGYGFSALMVRKDLVDSGRYKSFKDLKGMTVAIGSAGTGTASALNEALKKGGLKYSDVNVVELGFPEHLFAFTNKAVDASITNEPTVTKAVKNNVAVRIAGNDVIYPGQQTAVVLYSGEFIKNQPEAAQKFMRAYLKGVRDYNDALKDGRIAGKNADEILSILTEYTAIKDKELYRAIIPQATDPDGRLNLASLKKDLDFFREQKLISGNATVDQVVDNSFADLAMRDLGPYRPDK
ncbi:MAG: transporter substrate-binding protein [Herbaspirillum sp.]|jgi:NitT/TauT family transport system substrate-binding protein|nr:transporter substrate-binding protein [Herbaspirillum sp.]